MTNPITTDAQALAVLNELADEFAGGRPGSINDRRFNLAHEARAYLAARLSATSDLDLRIARGLIEQLPAEHEGRNSWLGKFGRGE